MSSTRGEPDLSENALEVLASRCLRRVPDVAQDETPRAMFERVACAVAAAEGRWATGEEQRWQDAFYDALAGLEFLPNSPTLMNAGLHAGQLSACFVLPSDAAETERTMARLQETGAGTGFSFSEMEPADGQGGGPLEALAALDARTARLTAGGRRRGANMGVLAVTHPDVIAFARAKRDGRALANFNLSVGIPDAFMEAVAARAPWALVHPRTNETVRTVPAEELFRAIVRSAWETGDPGLVFLDAIEAANPTPLRGRIVATNPCGEVPLLPYESCNLGSINLARVVTTGPGRPAVDGAKLGRLARLATRFLDDALEVNAYPFPALEQAARSNRKIGVGIMGWAELLIRLGLPYDTPEAEALARKTMRFIAEETHAASRELAVTRGVFPGYERSVHAARGTRLRNATTTAIAPTGTISLIANTTPGIEPLFGLAFRRRHVLGERTLVEVNPLLEPHLRERELRVDAVMAHVLAHGRLPERDPALEGVRSLFATALEIPPESHLRMQAAFQAFVDNGVSKTVNLREDATEEEVAYVYRRAWELRLKGVTVFRYGCKQTQILELGSGGSL